MVRFAIMNTRIIPVTPHLKCLLRVLLSFAKTFASHIREILRVNVMINDIVQDLHLPTGRNRRSTGSSSSQSVNSLGCLTRTPGLCADSARIFEMVLVIVLRRYASCSYSSIIHVTTLVFLNQSFLVLDLIHKKLYNRFLDVISNIVPKNYCEFDLARK